MCWKGKPELRTRLQKRDKPHGSKPISPSPKQVLLTNTRTPAGIVTNEKHRKSGQEEASLLRLNVVQVLLALTQVWFRHLLVHCLAVAQCMTCVTKAPWAGVRDTSNLAAMMSGCGPTWFARAVYGEMAGIRTTSNGHCLMWRSHRTQPTHGQQLSTRAEDMLLGSGDVSSKKSRLHRA